MSLAPSPYVSPHEIRHRLIEELHRALDCRRAEVHVPLRRPEVGVASQFLNRCDWGSSHRQVRTEGVAKDVDTLLCQTGSPCRPAHSVLNHLLRQGVPLIHQHPRPAQVSRRTEGRRQTTGHRDIPYPPALRGGHLSLPFGPRNPKWALPEIHIRRFQRHHLATSHPPSPPRSTIR